MADEVKKREPFDEYADEFTIAFNSIGANLSFAVSGPHSPTTGQTTQPQHLGTIRMRVENLKIMVFLMWHQIVRSEQSTGVVKVPSEVLDQFQISLDDWNALWRLK